MSKVLKFKINGAGEFRDTVEKGGHSLIRIRSRANNVTIGFQCWGPCGGWRGETDKNTNELAVKHLEEHGVWGASTAHSEEF